MDVFVVLAVALVASAIGFYFYKRHRRMIEAMSSEQRELYESEREYAKSGKKAERELWTATKGHEAKVVWAQGKLALAKKKGQGRLGSYKGVHGNEIELWENRVRVPRSGTEKNWMQDRSKRSMKEHYFQDGPVEARVEDHVSDELYLIVEGDNFVGFVQCKPGDAPKVRELTVKINNASRSINSVLQDRGQAIDKATADLEATQSNQSSIEAAEKRLENVKGETTRLETARASVGMQSPKAELNPSDE